MKRKKWLNKFMLKVFLTGLLMIFLMPCSLSLARTYMMETGPYERPYISDAEPGTLSVKYRGEVSGTSKSEELYGMYPVTTHIDIINKDMVNGNAVKLGDTYYIDKILLGQWIREMTGNVDHAKPLAEALVFKVTKEVVSWDERVHRTIEAKGYDRTFDPPLELIPLDKIAEFCGSKLTVNFYSDGTTVKSITVRSTEKPDTYCSYADKYFLTIDQDAVNAGENKIKFTIEGNTYNISNNDGIYVGFTYKKQGDASLNTLLTYSMKRNVDGVTVKKSADGKITYKNTFEVPFPVPAGDFDDYEFTLQVKDGVERESFERTFWIGISKKAVNVVPNLPGLTSGKKLLDLENQYGVIPKHTGGPPAKPPLKSAPPRQPPAIRAPATEKFMFSVTYTTQGTCISGCDCTVYDAPDMAYILYRINFGRDLQGSGNPLYITGTMSDMALCYYEENWSTCTCCSCPEEGPPSCSPSPYIASKVFTYRKIIEVPKGAGDIPLEYITISAKDGRGNEHGPHEIPFAVYTPMRTTYQLEKVLDPKYPGGQTVIN